MNRPTGRAGQAWMVVCDPSFGAWDLRPYPRGVDPSKRRGPARGHYLRQILGGAHPRCPPMGCGSIHWVWMALWVALFLGSSRVLLKDPWLGLGGRSLMVQHETLYF